jgi:hypothetical protein
MKSDSEPLEHERFRRIQAEEPHPRGHEERFHESRPQVVIAEHESHLALGISKTEELIHEIQRHALVAAPAVDDVPGKKQNCRALVEAQVDERAQREPIREAHALGESGVLRLRAQPPSPTEMKIRSVNEAEAPAF